MKYALLFLLLVITINAMDYSDKNSGQFQRASSVKNWPSKPIKPDPSFEKNLKEFTINLNALTTSFIDDAELAFDVYSRSSQSRFRKGINPAITTRMQASLLVGDRFFADGKVVSIQSNCHQDVIPSLAKPDLNS